MAALLDIPTSSSALRFVFVMCSQGTDQDLVRIDAPSTSSTTTAPNPRQDLNIDFQMHAPSINHFSNTSSATHNPNHTYASQHLTSTLTSTVTSDTEARQRLPRPAQCEIFDQPYTISTNTSTNTEMNQRAVLYALLDVAAANKSPQQRVLTSRTVVPAAPKLRSLTRLADSENVARLRIPDSIATLRNSDVLDGEQCIYEEHNTH